ncbi:tryptophan-rich sensory protein [Nocardioides dubius]
MDSPRADLPRLLIVSVAALLCLVGSMVGSGVFGGPKVADAAGGALAADATLIAPGGPAFAIWSVIYAGLVVYAIWQWLPAQRTAERHRRIGYLVAASMVLNAAWLLVVRQDLLVLSVVVIVLLVVVLGLIVRLLAINRPTSTADLVIADGTFGLYVGWVSVAVCANITAVLVDSGVDLGDAGNQAAAIGVLAVAGIVGLLLALRTHANLAIAAALGWGLAWIAVERTQGAPESLATAVAAGVVAAVVVLGTLLLAVRHQPR